MEYNFQVRIVGGNVVYDAWDFAYLDDAREGFERAMSRRGNRGYTVQLWTMKDPTNNGKDRMIDSAIVE